MALCVSVLGIVVTMALRTKLGRVLITGAGGQVATAFRQFAGHRYTFRLADKQPETLTLLRPGDEVLSFDISDVQACRAACTNIDTVLHLASDTPQDIERNSSSINNSILGTFNIFRAAKEAGCKRVVFASSMHAVEGYPLNYQVRPQDVPKPKSIYGISKAIGEGIATYFSHYEGLSALSVRIANCTRLPVDRQLSARDMSVFLSYRDAADLLDRCIRVNGVHHAVVHGISNNHYKRLSLEETTDLLGYYPEDDAFTLLGFA